MGPKPQIPTNMVYLKPVLVADLPEEIQQQAEGHTEIFAVHDAEGKQIALVVDKGLAVALARQNDMVPVTLH